MKGKKLIRLSKLIYAFRQFRCPVVKVQRQSTRIGAERCGFNPSSVRQFLVRIGKEARQLSMAEL
jgi:hypothetical protein